MSTTGLCNVAFWSLLTALAFHLPFQSLRLPHSILNLYETFTNILALRDDSRF